MEAWIAGFSDARKIEHTKLEFLALFTDEEKIRLKALEDSDPTVGLFWEEYRTADSIRLDDPRTILVVKDQSRLNHIVALLCPPCPFLPASDSSLPKFCSCGEPVSNHTQASPHPRRLMAANRRIHAHSWAKAQRVISDIPMPSIAISNRAKQNTLK